ncbi:TIGR04255 family protein [Erythrobacter sp. NE805]|uniref:TIGR04255 family protein n=1 Tax=Erythrobacter sp. NE805 TaxID=3389875 RepID=UPI00396B3F6B
MKPVRPNFERPPLQEQAISVVFQPLSGFRIVDYGLFWSEIADAFPEVSTDNPIEAPIEQFEGFRPTAMSFQLVTAPPLPRAMFRNPASGELVQLQHNRFTFNWAKVEGQEYPRSEPLMARFEELFIAFEDYARRNDLGDLRLTQCEITNLNVIPVADFGTKFAQLNRALDVADPDWKIDCLEPEIVERSIQQRIIDGTGASVGRLHAVIAPVISNVDNSQGIRYELTARSAPNISTLEQAKNFFGLARNAINAAFMASVTDEMKAHWGEIDGH